MIKIIALLVCLSPKVAAQVNGLKDAFNIGIVPAGAPFQSYYLFGEL